MYNDNLDSNLDINLHTVAPVGLLLDMFPSSLVQLFVVEEQ
jgi:hypothetical protein